LDYLGSVGCINHNVCVVADGSTVHRHCVSVERGPVSHPLDESSPLAVQSLVGCRGSNVVGCGHVMPVYI